MSSDARAATKEGSTPSARTAVGRYRPDRCDSGLADPAQTLTDGRDPVDAREDDPVVRREVGDGGVERAGILDGANLDERHDRDLGSETLERLGERPSTRAA